MSGDEAPPQQALNGGGGGDLGENQEDPATLKRPRSVGSFSDEGGSIEGHSPKKAKVIGSSMECLDKVNNGSGSSNSYEKKSLLKQLDDLAAARQLEIEYKFVKPPGYQFKLGTKERDGEFVVHLTLTGESVNQKFIGEGNQPYEAKREAAIKAKAYLTKAEDGEESSTSGDILAPSEDSRSQGFLSDRNSRSQESITERPLPPGSVLGMENSTSSVSLNGTNGKRRVEEEEDHDRDDDHEEDFYSDDEEEGGQQRGRLMLDEWWRKEKKKLGMESLEIKYSVKSSPSEVNDLVVMEVSLGDLMAEGDGENIDVARDMAAVMMLDQLKNILEEEGEEGLRRAIDEQGEEEQGEISANRNVVEEAVIDDTDDEEGGAAVQQKAAVHQNPVSQERVPAPPPPVKVQPARFGPQGEQVVPGEEYGLSMLNVRDPSDEKVMDVYNLPRRTKMSLLSLLARTEQDGEQSDDDEAEATRFLGLFQEVLALRASHRLGDHHMRSLQQMVARAGLAPQPQPQQAFYQPPPPPRPAAPPKPPALKDLCQFPKPPIEGVGSVTVTLEDYKTLQIGTFLNDTIIDFYLKHLQYTKLSSTDRDRVHIFTTFWFSRLTSKPSPIEARKEPLQRRHDKVKRWTRKVNIFEKDFVVVPINENYHWYLCIICYPGLVQPVNMDDGKPCKVPRSQRERRKKKNAIKVIRNSMKRGGDMRREDGEERDEPMASEDEIEHEEDSLDVEKWKKKKEMWIIEEARRREEEERRRVEEELRRREWEEQRRKWEEEQRLVKEEERRMLQRQLEEELAKEQEWQHRGAAPGFDEFDYEMMEGGEEEERAGISLGGGFGSGFADSAAYRSVLDTGVMVESAKARKMAAEWSDDSEEEEEREVREKAPWHEEPLWPTSMVAHTINDYRCDPGKMAVDRLLEELIQAAINKSQPESGSLLQVDGGDDSESDDDDDVAVKSPVEVVALASDTSDVDMVGSEASGGDGSRENRDDRDKDEKSSDEDDEDSNWEERRKGEERSDEDKDDEDDYRSDFDEEDEPRRREEEKGEEGDSDTEGNSEASDDGVMAALALFDSADASKPDPSPRSHLEESDSEIEAIEPEAEGNFKNDRSMMSEEGEEEEEEDENYEGEGEEEEEEDEDEEEEEDEGPPKPVKQPCILVFDSLGGKKDRQARLCQTLRDFLTMEWKEKHPDKPPRVFTPSNMPGSAPKVQQQPNLTDCGLYLCQNTETFFKNPIKDFTLPITSISKRWFPESEVRAKRENVAKLVRELATEQNQDKLEQLQFPTLTFRDARQSGGSDGEESMRSEDYQSDEDDFNSSGSEQHQQRGRSLEDQQQRRGHDDSSSRGYDPTRRENIDSNSRGRGGEEDDYKSDFDDDDIVVEEERRGDKRRRGSSSSQSSSSSTSSSRRRRRHKRRHRSREEDNSSSAEDDFDASAIYGSGVRRRPGPASMTIRRPNLEPGSRAHFGAPALPDASALAARLPPGISVSSLSPEKPSREPMVVNDLSSSDNDVIDDNDSDIVLDDIVIKKAPERSSDQLFSSMVAHCLPLLPSNSGDASMLAHRVAKECEATVLDWDLDDDDSPTHQDVCIGQVDGMADLDSGEEESEPPKDNETGEVSGDLEGEEVPGGGEEDELDEAQPEEGEAQPDVGRHLHQEEIPEESLVGDGVEDEDPMVQNHQPDGLAELVSNLGVDIDGIDVGVDEEGLDLEGEEEQDFDYENQQNQDLVGEEYLEQDYMEEDQVGEVFEEGEGHQAYYDEEQEEEDDDAYNDEEEGDFYQAYAQQPQAKKPKLQEQEEEVVLESSDDEEESNSVPAAAAKPQQWPQQRLPQQFGIQQPLHQQQQQGRAPIQAQFGLQLQQQAMYAELLHGRGSGQQQQFASQQFHHQFAPLQRKRRRRTPTALCIKDGRVFLRPFTDLPPHISAKSLPPPEQSPYQPSSALAASLMPSAISGHHLGSALGLGNPMGALGQLGHPNMGQQLGHQQAAAYPSLLPQFHQYPQHQMASGQLAVQPGAPLRPQQHPLLQRAAMAGRVGGSGSPTSLGSDSEDRSDSEVEEAEEEELGAMFPQRSKLPLMNPLKQQPLKEVSHGEEVLEEDDDDEIEALDNEGVGDEIEDDDEVMPAESNDNEPGAVNSESTREEVLTFEESSKDVQEAEEEIPVAATEEMLEAEEEEKKDNKEEKPREEEKEGGEGDDEGGAEELQ